MPTWAWIVIAVAIVALVAVSVYAAMARQRTKRLRSRFGPEYDRTVRSTDGRRQAESELQAREERRSEFQVRPLSAAARERYSLRWQQVQAEFVDNPASAVADADALIQSAMSDRGYPVEDFDQRAADVSVDYPDVVDHYRKGHRLAQASAAGKGSTEDLRQSMREYRLLFEELVSAQDGGETNGRRATTVSSKEVR